MMVVTTRSAFPALPFAQQIPKARTQPSSLGNVVL
jgi:hypothetical protein